MPSRNIVKTYVEGGIYHIYNRGVEKRIIFQDEQDYKVFLSYLKEYLSVTVIRIKNFTLQGSTFKGMARQPKNYKSWVELLAYCLMPNHFHLMLKQIDSLSMKSFMKSISTRYSMYFNKKYKRVGPLFQGIYKAVLVMDESHLLHLTRYIHLNPAEDFLNLIDAYSSYADYLHLRKTKWVNTELILSRFDNNVGLEFKKYNSYKHFIEDSKVNSKEIISNLKIEKDDDL